MKKEYTIRRKILSVLLGTLIVVCVCSCGNTTASYLEAESLEEVDVKGTSELEATETSTDEILKESEAQSEGAQPDRLLYVYVCGEVKVPGVYQLPEGSRIIDLFFKAGGLTPKAAKEYWNQAQLLEDGQMYYVPTEKEASEQNKALEHDEQSGQKAEDSDEKININTASKEQLMRIPGIGEAKALAILHFRQEHGAFSSIEDIMQVEGIKDGVFEKIKNYIKI